MRRIAWFSLTIISCLVACPESLTGDAVLLDLKREYPRYHLQFPTSVLDENKDWRWSFRGAPSATYRPDIEMGSPLASGEAGPPAQDSSAGLPGEDYLRLQIKDERGRVLCEASAHFQEWKLYQSAGESNRLWHPGC